MPPKYPYKVVPFTFDKVISLFSQVLDSSLSKNLDSNPHLKYLYEYLCNLGSLTAVLESVYIDHDYLEDYSGYYVRCFNRYRRTTSRIHFFSNSFNTRQFRSVILGARSGRFSKLISQNYLGFIVVKPLPQTIIGRTCLKTYPSDGNRRHFPSLHNYKLSLFGLPLSIDSLAYQEQDSVVAACATSALWSVFQGSGRVFHHPIPSPVEITSAATTHIPDNGLVPHDARSLHHSGLTATQIAHGIRYVGMEPYLVGAHDEFIIKSTAYAYLKAKIPSLLGIELYDRTQPNLDPKINYGTSLGKHAVTITGFSLGNAPASYSNNNIIITASRIDKIYVHDDQIGPFAKMIFAPNNWMQTNWLDKNNNKGNVYASAFVLAIPLYHKIRIPYDIILDRMAAFDASIESLRKFNFVPIGSQLEWDIYLTDVSEFKKELANNTNIDNKTKQNALFLNMPKYLWRATGIENTVKKFDILFDATDIEQGAIIVSSLVYDQTLRSILTALYPTISAAPFISDSVKMCFEKIANPSKFKHID